MLNNEENNEDSNKDVDEDANCDQAAVDIFLVLVVGSGHGDFEGKSLGNLWNDSLGAR